MAIYLYVCMCNCTCTRINALIIAICLLGSFLCFYMCIEVMHRAWCGSLSATLSGKKTFYTIDSKASTIDQRVYKTKSCCGISCIINADTKKDAGDLFSWIYVFMILSVASWVREYSEL